MVRSLGSGYKWHSTQGTECDPNPAEETDDPQPLRWEGEVILKDSWPLETHKEEGIMFQKLSGAFGC